MTHKLRLAMIVAAVGAVAAGPVALAQAAPKPQPVDLCAGPDEQENYLGPEGLHHWDCHQSSGPGWRMDHFNELSTGSSVI